MKKIIFSLIFIVSVSFVSAQEYKAEYFYRQQAFWNLDNFNLPPAQKKKMEEKMKEGIQRQFLLSFNNSESMYNEIAVLEKPSEKSNITITMAASSLDDKLYRNLKTGTYIKKTEFLGKRFLIEDKLPEFHWKLTSETKKIGEYTCYKATAIRTVEIPVANSQDADNSSNSLLDKIDKKIIENPIVAWYTMDIPISLGPENYWGLPGLIIEVSENYKTIQCTSIIKNPSDKIDIKIPNRGTIVSQQEFDDIMNNKLSDESLNGTDAIDFNN